MGNEIGNRAHRLQKGEPSAPLCGMALCAKTHDCRQRQLPTDELSCGNQPAHIRMIIVVTVCPGSLFRFPWRGLSMKRSLWKNGKATQKAA